MLTRRDWWLGIVAVVGAVLMHAWVPRYQSGPRFPFVFDRWTGSYSARYNTPTPPSTPPSKMDLDGHGRPQFQQQDLSTDPHAGTPLPSIGDEGPSAVAERPASPDFDAIAKKYHGTDITPSPTRAATGHFDLECADRSVRPVTGHGWQPASRAAGLGELRVTNGTVKDGVAVLFERLNNGRVRPRRAIYVRAGEEARFRRIVRASYTLRFMLGANWDDCDRRFLRDVECYEFVDALEFTERNTDDRVAYSKQSVTLHKVLNGNAQSTTIGPEMLRFGELVRGQ